MSRFILFDFITELVGEEVLTSGCFTVICWNPPVVPHPHFMLIQGETVFCSSKEDLTQEDWKTQTREKHSSDLKVSYVAD